MALVWKSRRCPCLTLALKGLIRPYCVVDLLKMLVVVVCSCFVFGYKRLIFALATAVGLFLQVVAAFRVDSSEQILIILYQLMHHLHFISFADAHQLTPPHRIHRDLRVV